MSAKHGTARSQESIDFLKSLADLCRKHKLSLSHEDSHGAFEVVTWNEGDEDWMLSAQERTP